MYLVLPKVCVIIIQHRESEIRLLIYCMYMYMYMYMYNCMCIIIIISLIIQVDCPGDCKGSVYDQWKSFYPSSTRPR